MNFLASIFLAVLVSIQYVTARPPIRIINGTTAAAGEFPYAVQIRQSSGYFMCGGSIIAPKWILTAGQCADHMKVGYTIIYGTTKLYDINDGTPNTSIAIEHLYLHPNYTVQEKVPLYDVGLLELAEPIPFNEYAQPIQLAEDNTNIPVHVDGVLSGWGIDNTEDLPQFLQKINLQLLTDDECTKKIDDYKEEPIFNSTHNICTNDYYNGGCYGDAGSAYVINDIQYGIVSWSLKACYGVVPNSYSRITNPEYRNWIRKIANV